MKNTNNETLRNLLGKGWLTHDAMWVASVFEECGGEVASRLNIQAIQRMTPIETKRFQKALGLPKVDTFEKLKIFLSGAFDIISGEFTDYRITYPKHNLLRWHAAQCFAYDGIKKLGMIDQYQCGIIERIEGWLKALDIRYEIQPGIKGCLMHTSGTCKLDMTFYFRE